MDLPRARFLTTPRAQDLLARLDGQLDVTDPVRLSTVLRREYPPDEAAAIAEQLTLRARARRLGKRDDLLLTGEGLEVMTRPAVAARRAQRLAAGDRPVADLTCGLGGDLVALAGQAARVVGVERAAVTAMLAAANVPGALVVQGTAERAPVDLSRSALFIDPMRRTDRGRTWSPSGTHPTWDEALALARLAPLAAIKTAPGLPAELRPPDAEIELVQVGRALVECACWFGEGARSGLRRAVIMEGTDADSGAEDVLDSAMPGDAALADAIGGIIFDPAPSVTVAGLIPQLAQLIGARPFDSRVGYLVGEQVRETPFARPFEVLDVLPFSVKRIRQRLRGAGWRATEGLRRAFPAEPQEVMAQLGTMEGEPVSLILTTSGSRRLAIIARPVARQLMSGNV